MSPTTPSRHASNHGSLTGASSALLSTPQSLGSAARSKDLSATGVLEYVVRPWIARDVQNARECPVDDMLRSFLMDCMTDEPTTMEAAQPMFDDCLERVRHICNGKQNQGIDSGKIKERLEHYSTIKREVDLYPAFVEAANVAFRCLREVDIEGLRKGSEELVFHVNGLQMEQEHQGQRSIRKPDVVLVSAADAARGDMTGDDAATKKPEVNFKWRNVRTVVEFKTGPAKPPPAEYPEDNKVADKLAGKYLLSKSRCNDDAAMTSSAQEGLKARDGSLSGKVTSSRSNRSEKRKAPPDVESESKQGSGSHSSKRPKIGTSEDDDKKTPYTQLGVYAAEMFASHAGRAHVISLVIIGEILYVWRFDRECTVQCSALNFIQDLPRFLLLLLAMQRFNNEDWGLHRGIDPDFGELPRDSTDFSPYRKMVIEDPELLAVDITLDMSPDTRVSHFGLNGRATNVYHITSEKLGSKEDLVAKLYWAETSRKSEREILEKVNEIAKQESDVDGHVPEMVYHHIFWETCTLNIRKRLGMESKGARVLCLIVFKKLMPITELAGDEYLKCWWDTVKCHLALWKNGVRHRDVSASNLMYKREEDNVVGVLNDFDLSTLEQGGTGNERTGTLPFMAWKLLEQEALAGNITHVYAHDAESFIWVLTWITLRYEEGKRRSSPHRYFDAWLKMDTDGCREKKSDFLLGFTQRVIVPGKGHERNWEVADACLRSLRKRILLNDAPKEAVPSSIEHTIEDDWREPFQDLLQSPVDTVKGSYDTFPI